jgi:phosphate transport system substrate-binding protein
MTDKETQKAAGIQHIPTVLGAIVITYNLPGVNESLRLDGDTVAKIYLGGIKKWDDPAIASQNPGISLPDDDIVVIHRSDGSGTSYVFTDYLSHVSAGWKERVGTSKNPQWPKGIGGQGNDGVTQQVKQNRNSIGYVELIYADTNHLPMAQLKDRAGDYITASTQSASLAASGIDLPADYRVSIVDSPAKGAYPIASFTYILLYRDQPDAAKGKALVDLLWWAVHDGQKTAPQLDYAPLPAAVVRAVELTLATRITSDGQALLVAP